MRPAVLLEWLASREPEPPAGLVEELKAVVVKADLSTTETLPEALAQAAFSALDRVITSSRPDRGLACELLAADALITYALEAQAATGPDALAEFASQLAERAGAGA